MDKQRGVSNHSTQSYRPGSWEEGGIPPQKQNKNWLSRKLKHWKGQATDFLRNHGILPNKPIHRRQVDEKTSPHHIILMEEEVSAPPKAPEMPRTSALQPTAHKKHTEAMAQRKNRRKPHSHFQQQSRVEKYLLEKPCEFALQCIDEERSIPDKFVKNALRPGLRMAWGKVAGITPQQSDKMIDILVHSFGLQGLDIDEEFLDSYEHSSRYAPLSPTQKFELILKLNEQLKSPEAQQNFDKILDTLEYYQDALGEWEAAGDEKQRTMASLCEYLINHAHDLPPLTHKGLAAYAHFSKFIESLQYEVNDIPTEMTQFMEYISDNPETFTAMSPSGIAARYIFSTEFDNQKGSLPDAMQPYKSDSE